jgi:hypothetical protein
VQASIDRARAAAEQNAKITVVQLAAPHDAMITHPDDSARILHEATVA